MGKGKGKNNAKATGYFAGYCLHCKGWGHMKKNCWWSATKGNDTSSLENLDTPAADTRFEPSITGMLIQSDEGEAMPVDLTQKLYSMTKREYVHNGFLIDSGAATSVCQQSLVDTLGGIPRGLGVELRSARDHQLTTTGDTALSLRTRDGINVASDFQIAPKDTGLQRSIISVGQVCDKGNAITFRITGGTILNEFTGSRIELDRAGRVYRPKADASTKTKSGKSGVKILMAIDTEDAAEAQLAKSRMVPVLPCEAEVDQHELTHLPFRNWCRHCVRAQSTEPTP